MIEFKEKPNTSAEIEKILHPVVREWFFSKFKEFSLPQLFAVSEIHARQNILVSAPTGATKTLTGFLSIINELIENSEKSILKDKVYCLYISPLKALNYDIEVNLKRPLAEIEDIYQKKLGIRVAVRTGDTTPKERTKMSEKPPHILITTPESIAILLNSEKFRRYLDELQWVIVDEIHSLAENKRGVHLSLSLERLQKLNNGWISRIGLSATVAPLEEVAKFLVGYENNKPRPCKIVNVQFLKDSNIKVLSPAPDLINISYEKLQNNLYNLLDNLIQNHRTTLIFTNTRAATERVVHHLKTRFPEKYVETISDKDILKEKIKEEEFNLENKKVEPKGIGAHHGSLSKTHRHRLEKSLREGKLKAVVCSTSLELGIDIGFIDLVILLGSPKSVARALQRIGRSGHQLHATTKGRIVVLDRDDLVECSVLLKNAIEKKIDRLHIPTNCSDVLAQHIFGLSLEKKTSFTEIYNLIRQSYCFKDYSIDDFRDVVEYLSGKYVSLEDRSIYAKIRYDEDTGMIGRKGKLGKVIYMTNIGTIPEQSAIQVKFGEQLIGTIDESFLERLKKGDIFVLGGDVYEFKFSRGQTAQVIPAQGKKPTVPQWFSEMLPLSFDLALEISKFRRYLEEKFQLKKTKEEIIRFILDYLYVDDYAANAIYEYFKEQHSYAKIANDKKIIIEYYKEKDIWYAIFHTLFGRRVNDALSRAVALAVSRTQHKSVEIGITDNGFYLASQKRIDGKRAIELLEPERLRQVLEEAIDKTEILKRRFRHCAARALMILRQYKGEKKRVGKQQVSSMILLNAVRRISENFPILKEAKREVLEDLMDCENAKTIVSWIKKKEIKIEEIETQIPSPFAFNLILQGYSDILKMEDRQEFLKRMHEMIQIKISLEENKKQKKSYSDEVFERKPFDYEEEWEKQMKEEENERLKREEKLEALLDYVSKKLNLDSILVFDIKRLIRGETKGFTKSFKKYIDNLTKEPYPKEWPSELIEFLKNSVFSYA